MTKRRADIIRRSLPTANKPAALQGTIMATQVVLGQNDQPRLMFLRTRTDGLVVWHYDDRSLNQERPRRCCNSFRDLVYVTLWPDISI